MQNVFVERVYNFDHESCELLLRVYDPEFNDGIWVCKHQIIWNGDEEVYPTSGVDKLQSLSLALKRISIDLKALAEEVGARMTWMDEPRLDLI